MCCFNPNSSSVSGGCSRLRLGCFGRNNLTEVKCTNRSLHRLKSFDSEIQIHQQSQSRLSYSSPASNEVHTTSVRFTRLATRALEECSFHFEKILFPPRCFLPELGKHVHRAASDPTRSNSARFIRIAPLQRLKLGKSFRSISFLQFTLIQIV